MNEHPLSHILNQLAEEGVPDDLDLCATIHYRLEMSKTQAHKGVFPMQKIIDQPRRTLAIIVVSVLLLVAVLLLTPQGRTWAQSTLRFFESAESDTRPVETLVPGADNTPWHFNLSIAEAESQADEILSNVVDQEATAATSNKALSGPS